MLSLQLGPLAISVGQALSIAAFLVALIVGKLTARRRDVAIGDTLINLVLVGVVTARAAFVAHYFSDYGLDPLAWIDIRDGGFEPLAGLLGMAACASYIAVRRPGLRRPMGASALAGVLTWGLAGGALSLIENRASQPPDAALRTLDGSVIDLAGLQLREGNRPMVVNLWATWCPPCRTEMPVLEQAQNARTDVLFVLANQGEAAQTVQQFLDQMQLDLDHVVLDQHNEIGLQAGSRALPTTLFYNAEGRLVDSHLGQLSKATLARALERFGPSDSDFSTSDKTTQVEHLP